MSAGIVYNYIIIFKAVVKYIYIYVYYILEFHMEEQQKRWSRKEETQAENSQSVLRDVSRFNLTVALFWLLSFTNVGFLVKFLGFT